MESQFNKLEEGLICKTDKYGDGVIDKIVNNLIYCYFKKKKNITLTYIDGVFIDDDQQEVNAWFFKMQPIASFVANNPDSSAFQFSYKEVPVEK